MQDSFGLVGATIAEKYRVQEVVGEGGFGLVYRGHHIGFDQPIAVKCLKVPTHFTGEARRMFIERFAEEGKLLFRLSEHRSIVRVFDHAVIEVYGQQVPYLVLEWLEGISLHDYLEQRRAQRLPPLSEIEALRLLREPIDGLAFAHQLRVAHRDIKPENLFLVRTGTGTVTKLLDFGVAKLMEEADAATQYATATSSGFRAFSPQYGAPEQFYSKSFGQTGPWTDVHAIGLLLTELVSARPAFEGTEFGEFYNRAIDQIRPTPLVRGASVTPAFEALCASALALETRLRYRNAGELLAAVDAHLQAAEELQRSAAASPRRRRARWIGAGLAGAAAIAAAVAVWLSGGTAEPAPGGGATSGSVAASTLKPTTTVQAMPVEPTSLAPAVAVDAGASDAADKLAGKPAEPPPGASPPDGTQATSAGSPAGAGGEPDKLAGKQTTASDGALFRIGDTVFVRHGDTTFESGQLKAIADGKVTVDRTSVSIDDISPAEAAPAKWEVGAMVLVTSKRRATSYLGKVTAVQDKALTLRFWDGRGPQWARFPDAGVDSGELARPVRVRAAWQTPLARVLDGLLARVARPRPVPRPKPEPPSVPRSEPLGSAPTSKPEPKDKAELSQDKPEPPKPDRKVEATKVERKSEPNIPSCADYCVRTAKQEKGTQGYEMCLSGCH
jgi:hypothetical protein